MHQCIDASRRIHSASTWTVPRMSPAHTRARACNPRPARPGRRGCCRRRAASLPSGGWPQRPCRRLSASAQPPTTDPTRRLSPAAAPPSVPLLRDSPSFDLSTCQQSAPVLLQVHFASRRSMFSGKSQEDRRAVVEQSRHSRRVGASVCGRRVTSPDCPHPPAFDARPRTVRCRA